MDKFESKLKRDAALIEADVSSQLADRIDASLHSAGRELPVSKATSNKTCDDHLSGSLSSQQKQRLTLGNLWLASSLTGLAAAVAVFWLLSGDSELPIADMPSTTTVNTVPPVPDHRAYLAELQQNLPLNVENVEFTAGLEEEMMRLRADLERARASVSRDIDFTF